MKYACHGKYHLGYDESESIRVNLEELNNHLAQFPFAKGYATKLGVIPDIIRIRNDAVKRCGNDAASFEIGLAAKEALARLGHVSALPSKGIRILCIDGGGMKGNSS